MQRELIRLSRDWPAGPVAPRLAAGEAHVWRVSLFAARETFQRVLSEEELTRADRFKFKEGRAQFAVTRAALRMLLARYLNRDATALCFETAEHGKPFLPGERLRFNVAHSGEWALIAVTLDQEIGVDLERTARKSSVEDLAGVILSERELTAWRKLSPADRRESFFKHWVAKEAHLKAIGIGLGRDPRTLETAALCVTELEVDHGYAAALAMAGAPPMKVRQFSFETGRSASASAWER